MSDAEKVAAVEQVHRPVVLPDGWRVCAECVAGVRWGKPIPAPFPCYTRRVMGDPDV